MEGGYVASTDNFRRTPLLWAAVRGHTTVVELALEMGAEIECTENHRGQTTLSCAAEYRHEEIVRLRIDRGAELNPEKIRDE